MPDAVVVIPRLDHVVQGGCVMYRHASTCLKGPVSRSRAWWQESPGEEIDQGGSAEVQESADDRRTGRMRLQPGSLPWLIAHDLTLNWRRFIEMFARFSPRATWALLVAGALVTG